MCGTCSENARKLRGGAASTGFLDDSQSSDDDHGSATKHAVSSPERSAMDVRGVGLRACRMWCCNTVWGGGERCRADGSYHQAYAAPVSAQGTHPCCDPWCCGTLQREYKALKAQVKVVQIAAGITRLGDISLVQR